MPAKRIYPTPDCVSADKFSPGLFPDREKEALKHELGVPLDKQVIVYLGLLVEYQGTDLLLEAIRHLKQERADFHLLLMGFPHEGYRVRADQLGISELVTFTGKVPYEIAPRYLALGDVAVAPKLSATEGSGKILNYMSMALPTRAFDTPVSREYLGDWRLYATERTLRFNYRGVGNSQRAGVDEKEDVKAFWENSWAPDDEAKEQDVLSAINFLRGIQGLIHDQVFLVGYSFGSYLALRAAEKCPMVKALVLISPTVHFHDFTYLNYSSINKLVVSSNNDFSCPLEELMRVYDGFSSPKGLYLVDDADHFFIGCEDTVSKRIEVYSGAACGGNGQWINILRGFWHIP